MRGALLLLCLLPGCSFPDPSITENLENVSYADGQFVAVGSNGIILT